MTSRPKLEFEDVARVLEADAEEAAEADNRRFPVSSPNRPRLMPMDSADGRTKRLLFSPRRLFDVVEPNRRRIWPSSDADELGG